MDNVRRWLCGHLLYFHCLKNGRNICKIAMGIKFGFTSNYTLLLGVRRTNVKFSFKKTKKIYRAHALRRDNVNPRKQLIFLILI
jgi:hypothetical protein